MPYVKHSETDASGAEAICKAMSRLTMRFVMVKSEGQQAGPMVYRVQDVLIQQRNQLFSAIGPLLPVREWQQWSGVATRRLCQFHQPLLANQCEQLQ
jgi:hypothetical protein